MKNENDLKIFIPKRISHTDHSDYAIATFCVLSALSMSSMQQFDRIYVSPQLISYYLFDTLEIPRRMTSNIITGLNELIENKDIDVVGESGKFYSISSNSIRMKENEKFVIISYNELKTIFSIDGVNQFLLLRYFIYLMDTLSSQIDIWLDTYSHASRVVGNMTITQLSELSNISERKIIDYNKILEDAGLIYIYRHDDFVVKDNGNIFQMANVYGRPVNQDYIDTFATNQQEYRGSYKYKKEFNSKSNNKRRLAQMYQQLLKGKGEGYSKEQITQIYQYVISENEKYQKMYEKSHYSDDLKKIRDTTVFDKFEWIKEEKFGSQSNV